MSTITGKEGQSIYDVAFMCYGTYDILKLMSENTFITDINYSDFAGKTINYTPVKNNGSFVMGLQNKIINTGTLIKERLVWDGKFIIWDGVNKLTY